jgi:hypothetical protein
MRRAPVNHEPRGGGPPGPLGSIGAARVRELAAARQLLRPVGPTSDHDRILDVVAERILLDLFAPGWRREGSEPGIVIAARSPGRVAAPSAC